VAGFLAGKLENYRCTQVGESRSMHDLAMQFTAIGDGIQKPGGVASGCAVRASAKSRTH
jgi:hypothetical protein